MEKDTVEWFGSGLEMVLLDDYVILENCIYMIYIFLLWCRMALLPRTLHDVVLLSSEYDVHPVLTV